ncbi:MAG: hypothetical protein GF330_11255 [Candidatus Eisenbacteria bacterium]|nr:hypothetical protein [Candidatus Eisenbacteria bacterium]
MLRTRSHLRLRRAALVLLPLLALLGAASPTGASTASLDAQLIPQGLTPDVSSLARFPASGLSLPLGIYGDLEPSSSARHAAVFALGGARAGLLYGPLDPPYEAGGGHPLLGGFLSLPAGGLRLGAALRGCENREEHVSDRDSSYTRERSWWATLDAGLALGRHSYLELAISGGRIEQSQHLRREHPVGPDSSVTRIQSECADPGSSYGAELRAKSALGHGLTGFALLRYRHEDLSVVRWDFNGGYYGMLYDRESTHPRERESVAAAFGMRGNGPAGSRVIAGLVGEYVDDDWTHLASSYPESPTNVRERRFATTLSAFIGLSAELRGWCDLFGGLSGNYRRDRTVNYEESGSENGRIEDDTTWSRIRGGFRLHTGAFYLDAVVANNVSASNPFTALSVGYRF